MTSFVLAFRSLLYPDTHITMACRFQDEIDSGELTDQSLHAYDSEDEGEGYESEEMFSEREGEREGDVFEMSDGTLGPEVVGESDPEIEELICWEM